MDNHVNFTAHDGITPEGKDMSVSISVDGTYWPNQCDAFFRFLLAQGFIVSERDVMEFFAERANEMSGLRSNNRPETEFEKVWADDAQKYYPGPSDAQIRGEWVHHKANHPPEWTTVDEECQVSCGQNACKNGCIASGH